MPTSNRRIATYIPKEIDDWFKSFKKDREISGDSQALIIILNEYSGVSQQVVYSSDSLLAKQVEELSSLLSELKSELATKVGEERISELRSELLSELKVSSSTSNSKSNSPNQIDSGGEVVAIQQKVKKHGGGSKLTKPKDISDGIDILTTAQLAQRFGIEKSNTITTAKFAAKKKKDLSYFTNWSKERDPDGCSWEFRSDSTLFYKVAHQSNH
jgi:hypothetical protein